MNNFYLSCESTADLNYDYVKSKDIEVLFYKYYIDGIEFVDDMGRVENFSQQFYQSLRDGTVPTTSQINTFTYCEYFRNMLLYGDVLHITFGTGMTNSYANAVIAADILKGEFPDRKLVVVDSTCSCTGYGMLVEYADDMRKNGDSIEKISEWLENNKHKLHHQFFTSEFKFFKKSGRVSGAAAAIGTILGICPIMRLDYNGKMVAYSKVRGKTNAIARTVEEMKANAQGGINYNGKCFICHSDCIDDAKKLAQAVKAEFINIKDISIYNIGPVIGSHCGPNTAAVFFMGNERPE